MLSTHAPSLLHSSVSGAEATSSLLFAPSASSATGAAPGGVEVDDATEGEHLELSLTAAPLHPRILSELALTDVRLKALDAEADAQAAKAKRNQPQQQRRPGSANKQKRKNASKRKSKAAATAAAVAGAAPASGSDGGERLVHVSIVADAANAAEANVQLVRVSIMPAATTTAAPSLIDLLATLAARPSASLPSSIVGSAGNGGAADTTAAMAQLSQLAKAAAGGGGKKGATAMPTASSFGSQHRHAHAAAAASGDATAPSPDAGQSSTVVAAAASPASAATGNVISPPLPSSDVLLLSLQRQVAWPFALSLDAMRVSDECEGHASLLEQDDLAVDRLHNRPPPSAKAQQQQQSNNNTMTTTKKKHVVLVGDHEVELLRTVGLLCAWERPKDGSALNRPVLVSQQPHLSFHVQLRITRLDPDEANARGLDELLSF